MTLTRTFQCRAHVDTSINAILHGFAEYFNRIERTLFADMARGKKANALKNEYLKKYQITARQFNAMRVSVEGKIKSSEQCLKRQIEELKGRIQSLEKKLKKLCNKKQQRFAVHGKKRRLVRLQNKLLMLEKRKQKLSWCFGSKKLFRAQFNLQENDYANHEEWLQEWRKSRSQEIFFLGSKDEAGGNQSCTATIEKNDTLSLRVRLPNALGKYLHIENVSFSYGKEEIRQALKNKQALSWRFVHDEKGWRFFVSFEISPPPVISKSFGVIGVDINVNHLALVETDRFGNPIVKKTIPLFLKGSTDQIKAKIGDAAKKIVAFAKKRGKALILEKLDFSQKKTALKEEKGVRFARMLSSFSYSSIITHIQSNAIKNGILVKQINPAFTSTIGKAKFARRYGLTIHQAASLVIGRRYLGCSEKPPSDPVTVPIGKNAHVTLALPVRNRAKHVWSLWRSLHKSILAAQKAHFRTAKRRSSSTVKTAPETLFSEIVGGIPACESSELLFC